jgi:hypothetical protein
VDSIEDDLKLAVVLGKLSFHGCDLTREVFVGDHDSAELHERAHDASSGDRIPIFSAFASLGSLRYWHGVVIAH